MVAEQQMFPCEPFIALHNSMSHEALDVPTAAASTTGTQSELINDNNKVPS